MSKPQRNNKPKAQQRRYPLNMDSDIIGLFISVPGDQISERFIKTITVKLPEKKSLEDEE